VTDTIKLVEQPVGSGKTHHLIRKIVDGGGLVIYCAPTKKLVQQVHNDITQLSQSDEYAHRVELNIYIVTDDEKGPHRKVSTRLEELILDKDNSEAIVVCTLAGIERVNSAIIQKAIDDLGKSITLIIDELPNLFSAYYQSFTDNSIKTLEKVLSTKEGTPSVVDWDIYNDAVRGRIYGTDLIKLLELVPLKTIRLKRQESEKWTFYGYELKENLNSIMKLSQSVYLLAATIKGTLDYIVLSDIWRFNLENCEQVNSQINRDKIKEKEGRIIVYPLLDESFSKSKGTSNPSNEYDSSIAPCLMSMLDNAISFIGDKPALLVTNSWSSDHGVTKVKDRKNIELSSPNVKGVNNYKDRHVCCAIYSAKPNGFTRDSLNLLSNTHNLDNLVNAFILQSELDMIVQMCGRTSIRDRESSETCHFIVSDREQARHVLKTYVSDVSLHDSITDESLMLRWADFSDTKIGRPESEQRCDMAWEMRIQLEYHEYLGTPLKAKDLAPMFNVSVSNVSKLLKDAGYVRKPKVAK
jgi:hypothetical protein